MDLRRFLDLYTAEAQEHVRLLQRSVLQLESGAAATAMEEAFRAAHTIKGISAAMGFTDVAGHAHALEDRLADVRSGGVAVGSALIDELLGRTDALEASIAAAIAAGPGSGAAEVPAAHASAIRPAAPAPAGTAWTATVRLQPDTAMPSVRALLVLRALEGRAPVLGSDPATFTEAFDGSFRIFLGPDADIPAVRSLIESAGDVENVAIAAPAETTAPAASGAAAAAPVRIRVDPVRLDEIAEAVGELSVLFGRLAPRAGGEAGSELLDRMGIVLAGLQQGILQLRMAPIGLAFERLPRVVRDAARSVGREVDLEITGDDVELDRSIIDEVGEPLVHLLRNAVDHGIETAAGRVAAGKPARGRIRLHAERERSSVSITVHDDGRGIDAARVLRKAEAAGIASLTDTPGDEELFRILSQPGMTTTDAVSAVSGRGVGLDVVASRIRGLGGAISMQTTPGQGTGFTIRLPVTLALAQALRVRVGDEDYVIPLTHVAEVVELNGDAMATAVDVRGRSVPLVRLRRTLRVGPGGGEPTAIVAGMGERQTALAVDELIGREQILIKPFEAVKGVLPYFAGATLLADGRPALVLDPLSVI